MPTKKTAAAAKNAATKNASAKKPATKKPAATKTAKATPAKKPAATRTAATKTAAKKADKKMSQIDAALTVLKKSRKPLSCKEMVDAMATAKLWTSPGGKKRGRTLYAAILRDIGKGDFARFKKAASNNNCSGRFTNA
jgi:hypothetical protein